MTATERIRAMLDERGVKWMPIAWNPKRETFYHAANGVGFCADEYTGGVRIYTDATITPEQAIEATLGLFNCSNSERTRTCHDLAETPKYGDKTRFECSACGYEYSAVGGFGCDYGDEPDFSYCPNCGRKVVE